MAFSWVRMLAAGGIFDVNAKSTTQRSSDHFYALALGIDGVACYVTGCDVSNYYRLLEWQRFVLKNVQH